MMRPTKSDAPPGANGMDDADRLRGIGCPALPDGRRRDREAAQAISTRSAVLAFMTLLLMVDSAASLL